MEDVAEPIAVTRRDLIVHDGLAFLALILVAIALFGVTLFLFRSFESHRADLAVRWAARGQQAIAQDRPEEAVAALRTALSYAPDDRPNQLLLAQALAGAGHTEEATNYFLNLWDATPGDGSINLQLARLSRTRKENKQAIDYYRAAIFGSWEGDGVIRRRQVRLELTDFLLSQRQFSEARNELFVVAGNSPNDPALNVLVGEKLEAADDPADALTFYTKALTVDPRSFDALARGGRLAYTLGDYPKAQRLLERALEEKPEPAEASPRPDLAALLEDAKRIQQLTLTRDQPASERADHILLASKIAQDRLQSCIAQTTAQTTAQTASQPASQTAPQTRFQASSQAAGSPIAASTAQIPIPLASLSSRWSAATSNGHGRRRALLDSAEAQDTWTLLIDQTELITAQTCGQPTGPSSRDNALLLKLANSAQKAGLISAKE